MNKVPKDSVTILIIISPPVLGWLPLAPPQLQGLRRHPSAHRALGTWVGWSGGLAPRCSGSRILSRHEGSWCLCSLFKLMAEAAAGVGVPRGGTDSFSTHMGLPGDSWGGGALPGKVQDDPH